jgi:hypothetical protein
MPPTTRSSGRGASITPAAADYLLKAFSFPDRIATLWFIIDGCTHLTIEALYLYFALFVEGGARKSSSLLAFMVRARPRGRCRPAPCSRRRHPSDRGVSARTGRS